MPEENLPDYNDWNAPGNRSGHYVLGNIHIRLDGIAKAQDQARGDFEKLQETVGKALEAAADRGYVIRRIEDRLTDLQARFTVVEQNYIKAEQHEKELAPFRKWGSWIGMLVIGGVVTALMALLFGEGALMPLAQRVTRFLQSAHAAFVSLYGLLLPIAAMMLLASYGLLLWVAVLREVDPIMSQHVVSVDPASGYLDRGAVQDITITREICSRRAQQVDLLLAWTEARPEGYPRPIVAFTRVLRDLEKGCHSVVVTQPVPLSLRSGAYVYAVNSRACSPLNRCVEHDLDAISFIIADNP